MSDKLRGWLAEELKRRGWSHREAARQAGVSQPVVSRVLSGAISASADFCISIAAALNTSPVYVLQLAGILPEDVTLPASLDDSTLQEILDIARNLPPAKREEALRYLRFLFQNRPNE